MADDVVRQPPKDGCISYLQGDCVCVGVIGFANRGMAFIQPLFGGSSACIGVTGLACLPRANVLNRSSAVFRLWRCIATMGQSDDDGGRCGEATADGGEVAYLRHAEVGVEENPGTLRCALHTGLRKSAVALRRESANRGMTFIQPLFGGRWVMRCCHGVGEPTPC